MRKRILAVSLIAAALMAGSGLAGAATGWDLAQMRSGVAGVNTGTYPGHPHTADIGAGLQAHFGGARSDEETAGLAALNLINKATQLLINHAAPAAADGGAGATWAVANNADWEHDIAKLMKGFSDQQLQTLSDTIEIARQAFDSANAPTLGNIAVGGTAIKDGGAPLAAVVNALAAGGIEIGKREGGLLGALLEGANPVVNADTTGGANLSAYMTALEDMINKATPINFGIEDVASNRKWLAKAATAAGLDISNAAKADSVTYMLNVLATDQEGATQALLNGTSTTGGPNAATRDTISAAVGQRLKARLAWVREEAGKLLGVAGGLTDAELSKASVLMIGYAPTPSGGTKIGAPDDFEAGLKGKGDAFLKGFTRGDCNLFLREAAGDVGSLRLAELAPTTKTTLSKALGLETAKVQPQAGQKPAGAPQGGAAQTLDLSGTLGAAFATVPVNARKEATLTVEQVLLLTRTSAATLFQNARSVTVDGTLYTNGAQLVKAYSLK